MATDEGHSAEGLAAADTAAAIEQVGESASIEHSDTQAEILDLADTADAPEGVTPQLPSGFQRVDDPLEDLAEGDKISRFLIIKKLGEGAMGRVLAAYDPLLDRKVAVKLLHPRAGSGPQAEQARKRLIREAQAMAKIAHPNVLPVFDAGEIGDSVFIAMEHNDGETLGSWTRREKRGWRELLDAYICAGRGLAAAHQAGLVHRDFKPDNVLVSSDGRIRVADFGLVGARSEASEDPVPTKAPERDGPILEQFEPESRLTQPGEVMGTPLYMAPEQHRGRSTDARCDQYAFCVAAYEALYGSVPYRANDYRALVTKVLAGDLPSPGNADVPRWVFPILARGLSVDPSNRYGSTEELVAALSKDPTRTRRRVLVAVAATMVVLGVGVVAARAARDPYGAAVRAADAAAERCDCARITVELPRDSVLLGYRPTFRRTGPNPWSPGDEEPAEAHLAATGELLVPRGMYVVDYRCGVTSLAYSLVSGGFGEVRTIALPAPTKEDGFVFVPGGQVPIGDYLKLGSEDEYPTGVVELAPYLISVHELADPKSLYSFDEARSAADTGDARLPTAAEWEWGTRLQVIEGALEDNWEWTGTQYQDYPYASDGRDNALVVGDYAEVRGGTVAGDCDPKDSDCQDQVSPARPSARAKGLRRGLAQVRLARDVGEYTGLRDHVWLTYRHDQLLSRSLQELRQLAADWTRMDDPPRLRVVEKECKYGENVISLLEQSGIDRAAVITATESNRRREGELADSRDYVVLVEPDIPPATEKAKVFCSTKNEVLERISFEKDGRLSESSLPLLRGVADTLIAKPSMRKVEVASHLEPNAPYEDKLQMTRRRAQAVVDQLVEMGVERNRLVPVGRGVTEPLPYCTGDPRRMKSEDQRRFLLRGGTCTNDRVEFNVSDRAP